MLSGHTHGGQIFPFTLLVKLFYPYIRGVYEEEGKYLHVSPGTGTWGPPMRLGSNNQITLLELVPAKN
jgi:predicted MPP superfamily phosphohydrolase